MYAIVRDRGRQYRMREGDVVKVDLMDGSPGSEVVFEDVLLVSSGEETRTGAPRVEGACVVGEVLGEEKGPKLKLFKQRRVSRSRTRKGHRQRYTLVRVKEIRAAPMQAEAGTEVTPGEEQGGAQAADASSA